MFTGIIEAVGVVTAMKKEGTNVHFTFRSSISPQMHIDQSVAHNGVCLTVTATGADTHTVTAVEETLLRTNLGQWRKGTMVNLERAMQAGARLDGHLVQGHVDTTGTCTRIEERQGSWYFYFEYALRPAYLLVDKGSICINGVSLTVVEPKENGRGMVRFAVAIIPYTFKHTNFNLIETGDPVNLEFDVIGKYVGKYMQVYGGKGV
ncbi:MAG TPA: riboflavin synthase [Bacteroidetes bacterium]|nr:riboflavin synthase [Bacteroidota bacterium]